MPTLALLPEIPPLNTVWFILIGVLLTGYVILDGFDLGIGILHRWVAKTDEERRTLLNAIGPVWDGNEVWLVAGGGALFAAFPAVYATVFSGFYLALVLLLFALIFRACAIEFRSKLPHPRWRGFWDTAFSLASLLATLLLGVALGNIACGVPLDWDNHEYHGGLLGLLNVNALFIGATAVWLLALHGALYGLLKTEGVLRERLRDAALFLSWVAPLLLWVLFCFYAIFVVAGIRWGVFSERQVGWWPGLHLMEVLIAHPWLFVLTVLNMLAAAAIPLFLMRRYSPGFLNWLRSYVRRPFRIKDGILPATTGDGTHPHDRWAFLASCATLLLLMAHFGVGMFPNIVYSHPHPENSLTVLNAASSQKTLGIMLIIALIGMPLVIAYTAMIYRVFRGKVRISSEGY